MPWRGSFVTLGKIVKSFLPILALCIFLAGCASSDSGRQYPGGALERAALPSSVVVLSRDVEFKAKPNWGMARIYVLPAGEYRYHGKDKMGYFFEAHGEGISL